MKTKPHRSRACAPASQHPPILPAPTEPTAHAPAHATEAAKPWEQVRTRAPARRRSPDRDGHELIGVAPLCGRIALRAFRKLFAKYLCCLGKYLWAYGIFETQFSGHNLFPASRNFISRKYLLFPAIAYNIR